MEEAVTKVNFRAIVRAYDRYLERRAGDARLVGWRSEASQHRKFAEIAELFADDGTAFSVYDVGCGLANLYDFLKQRYPLATYKGCDIHPGMTERARLRNPKIDVECRDILRSPPRAKYDYVVASGTFNLRLKTGKDRWEAYVKSMLRAFYGSAKRGIAVGFLSSLAENKERREYYPSAPELLDFAQRRLSPFAEIRHSGSPGHFALFVYRFARVLTGVPPE